MNWEVNLLRNQRLLEQLETAGTFDQLSSVPRKGPERLEALEAWIKEECVVRPDRHAPELKAVWLEDAHTTGYPIRVLVPPAPKERRRFFYEESNDLWDVLERRRDARSARRPYFADWNECDSPIRRRDVPELERRFLARFNETSSAGNVEITGSQVKVSFGRRRPEFISESDVAALIFLEERADRPEDGARSMMRPALYCDLVAPHFRDKPRGTPFEWAAERLAIVHGYAQTLVGRDLPVTAAEISYRETARIVCNLHPARLNDPVVFNRTPAADALRNALGEQSSPEAMYLVHALQDCLTPEDLTLAPVHRFFEKLPGYLQNGLAVDRVADLVRDLRGSDAAHVAHAVHAFRIVDSLFGGAQRPWWFHEDQRLSPETRSSSWGTPESRRAHGILAARSGPLYQYAREVWETSGVELLKLKGVTLDRAVDLVVTVTRAYGIGNVSRADNVLIFARAALAEGVPDERGALCAALSATFEARKPRSEIIGALEGSDANFSMPGLAAIATTLGSEHDPDSSRLYGLTFKPEQIRAAIRAAEIPIHERAIRLPQLQLPHETPFRLITKVRESGILALPGSERNRETAAIARPLNSWVEFDRRLRDEVSADAQAGVARLYLTHLAHKMPQPFQPPDGFLALVYRLSNIYDPVNQPEFMVAPSERYEQRMKNTRAHIDRWAMVGSWLDTAVLGLQSYDEVVNILSWVLLDEGNPRGDESVFSADRRALQIEGLWRRNTEHRESTDYAKEHRWGWRDAELREEEQMLEILGHLLVRCAHEGTEAEEALDILAWTRNELRSIRERRNDLEGDAQEEEAVYRRSKADRDACEARLGRLRETEQMLGEAASFVRRLARAKLLLPVEARLGNWLSRKVSEVADRYGFELQYNFGWSDREVDRENEEEAGPDTDPEPEKDRDRMYDQYDWTRHVEDLIREETLDRFRQLGRSMEFLTALNATVASGMFPPSAFRPALEQCVQGLKDGTLRFPEKVGTLLEDLPEALATLKEIRAYGLAELGQIETALATVASPIDLVRILDDIGGLVTPYRAARQCIASELSRGSRYLSGRELRTNRDLEVHMSRFVTGEVRTLLAEGSPLFVRNAAELMIREFFWVERYRILAPHVAEFLDSRYGREWRGRSAYGRSDIDSTLTDTSRMVTLAWLFTELSEVFREEGGEAFMCSALPETDGVFSEEALGTALPQTARMARGNPVTDSSGSAEIATRGAPLHLTRGIPQRLTEFEERIIECRRRDFGLLATGGKIHVLHEIDSLRLSFLKEQFGLGSTQFMVDNAKHLVVLPATSSAAEIQLIANLLNVESIIDGEFPEIQMCIAGRLSIGSCALLGASVMLCSDVNVPYNENSFATTASHATAFRIMIYDAGGTRNQFPFDVTRTGRTDMLGRRTLGDFRIYQILGSVLSYAEEPEGGGNTTIDREHLEEFRRLATVYRRGVKHILDTHGLKDVLGELWLNPTYLDSAPRRRESNRFSADHAGGRHHFRRAIQPIMDAWDECADAAEAERRRVAEETGKHPSEIPVKMKGVVGEMRALLRGLEHQVRLLQQDMLHSPSYARHREQLFRLGSS